MGRLVPGANDRRRGKIMERIKGKKQLLTDKEIRSILPVAGLTVCAVLILAVSTDTFLSRQKSAESFCKSSIVTGNGAGNGAGSALRVF